MDVQRVLEDGKQVLYRRNGIWQARIRGSVNRYIYRSLRASDEAKATPAGRKLFYQTEVKLAEGLPVHNRTPNSDKTGKLKGAED